MSHAQPPSGRSHDERNQLAIEVGELGARASRLRREVDEATRQRDHLRREIDTSREQASALRGALSRGEYVRDRLREELAVLQRRRDALEAAVGVEGTTRHHPALMHVGPGRSALVVDLLRRIARALETRADAELSHLGRGADRLADLVERDSDTTTEVADGSNHG